MTDYHEDSRCGSCLGPLEVHRDAICTECAPDPTWRAVPLWKRLPIIRHVRYFYLLWCLDRWWNNVGRHHWLLVNDADIEYLNWVWNGKA